MQNHVPAEYTTSHAGRMPKLYFGDINWSSSDVWNESKFNCIEIDQKLRSKHPLQMRPPSQKLWLNPGMQSLDVIIIPYWNVTHLKTGEQAINTPQKSKMLCVGLGRDFYQHFAERLSVQSLLNQFAWKRPM